MISLRYRDARITSIDECRWINRILFASHHLYIRSSQKIIMCRGTLSEREKYRCRLMFHRDERVAAAMDAFLFSNTLLFPEHCIANWLECLMNSFELHYARLKARSWEGERCTRCTRAFIGSLTFLSSFNWSHVSIGMQEASSFAHSLASFPPSDYRVAMCLCEREPEWESECARKQWISGQRVIIDAHCVKRKMSWKKRE